MGKDKPQFPRWRTRDYAIRDRRQTWFDTWGSRINHVSQLGLFALGLIGFFYVVLPVYQKSVLEESVAKLQTDLKAASQALEKKESDLRNASTKLAAADAQLAATNRQLDESYSQLRRYAVAGFVIRATATCSGMLIPPVRIDHTAKDSPRYSWAQEVLALVAPNTCLQQQLKSGDVLNRLNKEDRLIFSHETERIASVLEQKRLSFKRTVDELPTKARADPTLLRPFDNKAFPAWAMKFPTESDRREFEFERRLADTTSTLTAQYIAEVNAEIGRLTKLDWDKARAQSR